MLLLLASRSRRQRSLHRCSHALAPSEGKSPFARAAPAAKANPNDAEPSSFQIPPDLLNNYTRKPTILNVSEYLSSTSLSNSKGVSPEMREKIDAKEEWDRNNAKKIEDAGHSRTAGFAGFRRPKSNRVSSVGPSAVPHDSHKTKGPSGHGAPSLGNSDASAIVLPRTSSPHALPSRMRVESDSSVLIASAEAITAAQSLNSLAPAVDLPTSAASTLLRSSLHPRVPSESRPISSPFARASASRPAVLSSLSSLVEAASASDTRTSIFGKYLKSDDQSQKKEAQDAPKPSSFKIFDDGERVTGGESELRSILEKNLPPTRGWRLPTKQPAPEDIAADAAADEKEDGPGVGEVTEGERRYLQYQQRLKVDKAKFAGSLPKADMPDGYCKNAPVVRTVPAALSAADLRKQIASELSAQYRLSLQPKPSSSNPAAAASSSHRSQGTVVKELAVPACGLTLREVASRCSLKLADVRGKLLELGEVFEAEEDEGRLLDADVIELLGLELGLEVKRGASVRDSEASRPSVQEGQEMHARSPVVCVMGHVDHGKTTLLDALRKASVAASEAGGITQKLSAFVVEVKERQVVFLDTPGHAAFTAMRSHGAAATDVVILVVAADDGVQPQTREAIRIAKAANCSIVVALNKIDKFPVGKVRESARLRVLTELLDLDLVAESFGGDVQVVEVSGRSGEGLDALVEGVLLQADVLNLVAASEGRAECTVLEATMEKGRGVVCDVLVSWGKLCVGDNVVVGTSFGKVKAMTSDTGVSLRSAGPASPVRLLGLRTVPSAGQELISVTSEAKARQIVERRQKVIELRKLKQEGAEGLVVEAGSNTTPLEVNVLLKADGHGTLNALQQLMTSLQSRTSDVTLKIMSSGVGDITRTEVESASTVQNVFILGFNISLTDSVTRDLAKQLDIRIFRDTVIYRLEDALIESMQSLMPRERLLELEGKAKVLQLFAIKGKGQSTSPLVAGLSVTSGSLKTSKPGKTEYMFKVMRGSEVISEGVSLGELKRFKDVVHEVSQGNECGLSFESFRDFEIGDELECYRVEWRSKPLSLATAVVSDKSAFDQQIAATG